jgi:hypothetical protein
LASVRRTGLLVGMTSTPEFVDVEKLLRLGFGGAGHAGQFVVEPEVILNGDGGERLGLAFDLDAFLGLDGLVQAIAPAAAGHEAAGVFVDDDDLVVLDDVLDVLLVEAIGLEQLGDAVDLLRFGLEFGLDPRLLSMRLRTSVPGRCRSRE